MYKSFAFPLFLSSIIGIFIIDLPALAHWGTFTLTDGSGEDVVVKHGLLGRKTIVKDRSGNGFATKRSLFGLTKTTEVGVLGNDVRVHKGLFGFGKTEAHSMLGDTVTSSKNPLFRNTKVNLQGVGGLLNNWSKPKAVPGTPTPIPQNIPSTPNTSSIPSGSSSSNIPIVPQQSN